jgi:hypothetical protein
MAFWITCFVMPFWTLLNGLICILNHMPRNAILNHMLCNAIFNPVPQVNSTWRWPGISWNWTKSCPQKWLIPNHEGSSLGWARLVGSALPNHFSESKSHYFKSALPCVVQSCTIPWGGRLGLLKDLMNLWLPRSQCVSVPHQCRVTLHQCGLVLTRPS